MVYLAIVPTYERLSDELAWQDTSAAERTRREREEPIKQRLSRIVKWFRRSVMKRDKLGKLIHRYVQCGNVLDVGCADGGFLANLPDQYTPHGIEISRELADAARRTLDKGCGTIIHDSAVNGMHRIDENSMDCIVMSSFLEHEPMPLELLTLISQGLKRNGVAIIKVPNFASINRYLRGEKWCGYRFPDHVNYFTPESLRMLVRKAGLSVVQFGNFDRQPFSDNMWLVARAHNDDS